MYVFTGSFGSHLKKLLFLYMSWLLALANQAIIWVAALQLLLSTHYPLTILNAIVCSAAPSLATYDVCMRRRMPCG
jgi:hypothetical protein